MKKINELVTTSKKTEQKSKRSSVSFGSFKRAEEKEIAETKKRKHEEELTHIAEGKRIANAIRERKARIDREAREEKERVIKEEIKRKRDDFITGSLSNAFGTKTKVDFTPVREEVIDKYLPQLKEPEKEVRSTPFKTEPALNAELEEFKKKINEHLHTVGFMGSGGGGIGDIKEAGDVDISNRGHKSILMYNDFTKKYEVADPDLDAGISNEDDSGDEIILNATTTSGDDEGGAIQQENSTRMATATGTTNSSLSLSTPTLTLTDSDSAAITVDLSSLVPDVATVATTVTITDNESTDENNALIFTAGGDVDGGNIGLESDGTLTYNPSTGKVTATGFVGTLTGDVTGNVSGTAATVTTAAQSNITSLGTLTTLTVDNIIINATTIGHTSSTDAMTISSGGAVTFAAVPVFPNDTVETADIQADAITGAKIADDAIDSEHYTDGSIDTAHIAAAQVTGPKLGGGVIGAVGFSATTFDLGTNASGTETLDEANGNFQKGVNGGAHTLAPQSNDSTIVIQYTNNASAGTITVSGYDTVTGDSLTTTNGHDFLMFSTVIGSFQNLNVQALQ